MLDALPTPVLARIIAFVGCGSSGWRNISLVCKAVCCRVNIEKLRLLVPASAAAWEGQLNRIAERNFQPHHLQLVSSDSTPAQPPSLPQSDAWKLMQLLQLRPLLQNLHTLRVRGLDVSEAVLEQLALAAPHMQQLFLDGVEFAVTEAHSSSSSSSSSDMQPCQHSQQAAVTAVVPAEPSEQCTTWWCKVTANRPWQPADAERRIAKVLSQFQCLHTLRMDCQPAQGVMLHLCELWGGSADVAQASLDIRRPSAEPQVVHIPSLGWYLFRAVGSSSRGTANFQSSRSSPASAAVQTLDSMHRQAAPENQPSSSVAAEVGRCVVPSSTSCRSCSPAVSCPGVVDRHEHLRGSTAVAQLADDVAQLHLEQQQQDDDGPEAAGRGSAVNLGTLADTLTRSSSIGRHSLDLQRCLAALPDDEGQCSSSSGSSSQLNSSSSDSTMSNSKPATGTALIAAEADASPVRDQHHSHSGCCD